MQMPKDAIALNHDLRRQFILFEYEGQLKAGWIFGYKVISGSGAFDPTSLEVAVDKTIVMKIAEIQNAYIMTSIDLVQFANKSAEMGAKAQETLNKIYGFLETLKEG